MYVEIIKHVKNLNKIKWKGMSLYGIKHVSLKYLTCTSNLSIQYNLHHNSRLFTQIEKIILIFQGTEKTINTCGSCYIVNLSQPKVT